MKNLGFALISISFLAGAYLASLDAQVVDWTLFVPVLVLGFVGVALARIATKQAAGHADVLRDDVETLTESLSQIIDEVARLEAEKDQINVYDLPKRIDANVLAHLNRFVSVRDTMKHAYGLQVFANVMGPYAGGERYLNRVWSSAADGYIDEAQAYITHSLVQFRAAQEQLEAAAKA